MTEQKIKDLFTSANPEIPEHYRLHVRNAMEHLMEQEEQMKDSTKQAVKTAGRFSFKTISIAVLIVVLAGAVALAAIQWNVFDTLSYLVGKNVSPAAGSLMQENLYQETVNNVEITVREAGYDGRTLLLQYAYRILDVDEAYGITALEEFGEPLPEGMDAGTFVNYREEEAEKALREHNVGWNFDQLWFNGVGMDMPGGSGATIVGSDVPGEIIHTEFWRLDNMNVTLDGLTEITLPIGELLPDEECHNLYDRETGMYRMPEKGVISFTYDAKNFASQVKVLRPDRATVLPEGTVTVKEADFTPLMTYITVSLEVNPDTMAAFIAENGENMLDDSGNVITKHGPLDVFEPLFMSLELVDSNGTVLFPDNSGLDSLGNEEAKFLYPAMETVPDELFLAPVSRDGSVDMNRAIPVIAK